MLKPVHEPYTGPISYPLHSTLVASATTALRNAGTLALQLPYGEDSDIFPAGLIGCLSNDGGTTAVRLADATTFAATFSSVILAGNFIDALKSEKVDCYALAHGGIYTCYGNYITTASYAVGTQLTYVPSGADQGKLCPLTAYASQRIVAIVITPPTSPSDNDEMIIQTIQPDSAT